MMGKRALITGVSGQDGTFLSHLLHQKGYHVTGTTRSYNQDFWRLRQQGIEDQIDIKTCDLRDSLRIVQIVADVKPDEIYNLAAQSSVSLSFSEPASTISSNVQSLINLLESIRIVDPTIKLYQASSSEMFGNNLELPLDENSRFDPLSPYAVSKAACHWITRNYRDSFGIFACSGILFNHESVLRSPSFFVKKIVRSAAEIKAGSRSSLEVGNIEIARDFGCAERYVEAMWLMLQQDDPRDFVICSGKAIKLKSIVEYVLDAFGISEDVVHVNESLFRPSEIDVIYGDSRLAQEKLGWNYNTDFFSVVSKMIESERCKLP